jgi:hypothetical protein
MVLKPSNPLLFFPELCFPTGNCLTLKPKKLNPGFSSFNLFRVWDILVLLGFNSNPMPHNHFSISDLHSFITSISSWRITKSSAYLIHEIDKASNYRHQILHQFITPLRVRKFPRRSFLATASANAGNRQDGDLLTIVG